MFGISLTEVAMIALVALVVVGPQKLPGMLRTLGEWVRRIRQMTTQVRAQTGIDDILRQEGIDGGLAELRGLIRGDLASLSRSRRASHEQEDDPYERALELDRFREYPPEGVDAAGALPDDLVDESDDYSEQDTTPDEDAEGALVAPEAGEQPPNNASSAGTGSESEPAERRGSDAEPAPHVDTSAEPSTEKDSTQPTPAPWSTKRDA